MIYMVCSLFCLSCHHPLSYRICWTSLLRLHNTRLVHLSSKFNRRTTAHTDYHYTYKNKSHVKILLTISDIKVYPITINADQQTANNNISNPSWTWYQSKIYLTNLFIISPSFSRLKRPLEPLAIFSYQWSHQMPQQYSVQPDYPCYMPDQCYSYQ